MKSSKIKTYETTFLIIGVLCFVQGFGSVVTERYWSHSFGISGILIGALGTPTSAALVVGVVGIISLALSYWLSRK